MNERDGVVDTAIKPQVGMGVTQRSLSGARPYTIIRVQSHWQIVVQRDRAIQMSGTEYNFARNPFGDVIHLTRRADGIWRVVGEQGGSEYTLGERAMYNEP